MQHTRFELHVCPLWQHVEPHWTWPFVQHMLLGPQKLPDAQQVLPQHTEPVAQQVVPHANPWQHWLLTHVLPAWQHWVPQVEPEVQHWLFRQTPPMQHWPPHMVPVQQPPDGLTMPAGQHCWLMGSHWVPGGQQLAPHAVLPVGQHTAPLEAQNC